MERYAMRRYRHIRTLSPELSAVVRKRNPLAHIYEIPLAIDVSSYNYSENEITQPTFGMIGTMCWRPTIMAARRLIERIAPIVRSEIPGSRLLVGGWNARSWLSGYSQLDGVEVIENVPDAEQFFRQLTCMVYPAELGSGMKVKILESMAYGVPVVTSPVGLEGLQAKPGKHLLLGGTDQEIASQVVLALKSEDLRQSLGRAGRSLVEKRYSSEAIIPRIEDMFAAVLAHP
jgi:glycosyltransferase involved in cell wall biosynthesis